MAVSDFFESTTVETLVQSHIEEVTKLEEASQEKLVKVYKEIRRELQDRLLTIPEGTFTQQQLQVTLIQVEAAIQALNRGILQAFLPDALNMGKRSIAHLLQEIRKFSATFEGTVQPIQLDRVVFATEAQNFLVNKYETSIEAYGADLRSSIADSLVNALAIRDTTERTVSRLVSDVGRFFIGEEWKLRRIARTELHNVYNFSKLKGLQAAQTDIPDIKKGLIHPMDDRTGKDSKKLALENPVIPIDQPFQLKFKGETRTFQFPPDRPNDRSILIPVREEWIRQAA